MLRVVHKFKQPVDQLCKAVSEGHITLKDAARTHPPQIALLAYMRCRGVTQERLGEMTGMTQPTVSSWLNGKTAPEMPQRKILEAVCSIPAENWDRFARTA